MTAIHRKLSSPLSPSPRRALLGLLLAAGVSGVSAQDDGARQRQAAAADATALLGMDAPAPANPRPGTCPNPVVKTVATPPGATAAAPLMTDFPAGWSVAGSVFNQTQTDKHFGHTLRFEVPKGCCQYNAGVLEVTYKALSNGSSNKSSDAGNDGGGPVRNGQALNNMQPGGYNHIWPNTGVTAGTVLTRQYNIPASWIASGHVSFGAQDDTAVLGAKLHLSGCCLTATQPER